ncbi:MAG: leucyl aminopeptidase [Synergistaceae bacterium]|jgi:leucyl aminopeptidase|nr:leucyl aminopeptidase [Synergistaceae bacterium]
MVNIATWASSPKEWQGDALLALLHEEDCKERPIPSPWDGYGEYIEALLERGDFEGKKGSLTKIPLFEGAKNVKNLYLAGLGKIAKRSPATLRDVLTGALRKIGRERNRSILILSDQTDPEADMILGESAGLCGYVFDKYKKKEEEDKSGFVLEKIFVQKLDTELAAKGQIFADSQCFARDLANEPGNVINPVTLAEIAINFAKEQGLTCEVWNEKKLADEKMGALLAVGQGSKNPPRLIHLTYTPKDNRKENKIVFVGKGITFDSGGLDLKPSDFMKTMKGDKSGACNVLGIMKGAAALGVKAEIHGIIAAAENMPGGNAFRPDDIIRARNGKTIEIDNTDAEGRLVLADALAFASEMRPNAIIDMATLTGACAVALGSWSAGLFTMNEGLCESLLASSGRRGERLWRLPMDDEKIGETLKSKFADLVNGANRYGGATFAAMFLNEFVEKEIPWAHIDIAGADFMKENSGVYARGASAWGVRTCLDYLTNLY